MFRPFMCRYSALDRLTPTVTVAQESFVYQVEQDEWERRLAELRAVRLPEEILDLSRSGGERHQASHSSDQN